MKQFILAVAALFSFSTYASFQGTCSRYSNDEVKVETLEFLAKHLKFETVNEFCTQERLLDAMVTHAPNFWPVGEEEDHHVRVILSYEYHGCTYYYNQTQKFITREKCYNIW